MKKWGIPLELWVCLMAPTSHWPADICRIGAEYNARLKRVTSSVMEFTSIPMVKWQASAPKHLVDASAPADQFHVRMLWLRYRAIWSHRRQFMIDGRLFGGLRTRSKTMAALIHAIETGTDLPILRILRKPQRESYFLENPDERPAAVPSKPAKS